ncbi:hypothetical protein GS72_23970 [Salmonella enterica subsp. enterica serovar Give]|nr:hypothetical protein [Salmonella enterica subsp. enterica serovar Give]
MQTIQYNKYSTAHLIHTIQKIHTVRSVHTLSLFFRSDPDSGRTGSYNAAPARYGPETQHVAFS